MSISVFKIMWKRLTGGKAAVADYLLECANNAADRIPAATAAELRSIFDSVLRVRGRIDSLAWLCPEAWRGDLARVLGCLDSVIDALRDGRVAPDELRRVCDAFQLAWAKWRAE